MAVSVNANALATRSEVKDFLNVVAVNNDIDDLINQIINRMSDAFESYCNRKFASADYTEYHDGGVSYIFPKNTPIIAIAEINDDSDWVFPVSSLAASGDYRILENNHVYYSGIFESGPGSVKIVYTGGYTTIPDDLKQAAITEIARIIKHRVDFDVLSVTRDDGSVTYNALDYLPLTLKTLNFYKANYIL
jgi:hypothetical protein